MTWTEAQLRPPLTCYRHKGKLYVRVPILWQRLWGAKGAIRSPLHWTGPIPELEPGELGGVGTEPYFVPKPRKRRTAAGTGYS